jgi:hypothetical protein
MGYSPTMCTPLVRDGQWLGSSRGWLHKLRLDLLVNLRQCLVPAPRKKKTSPRRPPRVTSAGGGIAGKLGDVYEAWWTIWHGVLSVLDGTFDGRLTAGRK